MGHKTWDPEDMADSPEQFLKGVNPEEDNFGLISGLKLWIELAQKGLMESCCSALIEQFEQALARYQ